MRLPPLPGEAFESWLVAYAHRLDSPTSDILAQAGLSTSQVSTDPRTLALGPSADTLQRLSDVTGHDCSELESTFVPLRQYSAGLSKVRIHGTSFLGAPMRASRFCPECLDANGGRWMASWRLPWVVACPTHGILLATHCPDCESEQRRRPILTESTPNDPRHCANPASGSIGRAPTRCEADLTGVFTHPAPTALVHLSESWNEFHAVGRVTDLLRLVGDVAVLSSVIGTCASAGEALAHPEKFADVLAQAAEAVLDPEGSTFTELASRRVSRKAPALPAGWTGISEGLVSRALVIRDPSMRPLDRIRWASATRGRRPSEVRSDALSREGKVPASLWPEWALLLAPPGLESAAVFPAAAAGCMLLRGSTLPLSQLMKMLSDDPTDSRSAARSILQATANDPGHTILPTLTKLSETLEAEPPPIDYARRRRWAAERDVLSRRDWVRLCEGTSSAPGEARKWRYARLRVWETLTGGMAHQAPSSLMAGMTDPLSVYYQFLRNLTPAVLQALTAHAREVLDAWGLEDEPVEWVPSLSIIGAPSDVLPGVSRQQLEGRVPIGSLAGRRALSDCAADVGLDIQQAKLIVRLGWFAPEPSPGRPARTRLSEAQVRDAIEVRGLTLRQTAAELGVDRKTVRQRCLELEIDLHAPGRRRRWNVDKEWLATQYVTRGRPLPDIAAEVGCSTANLARIAKEHGIPLRGRGGASHGSATVTTGDLPPLLAACLRGQGARERVERFHQIAAFRSLNEAAQSIGLHQSAISTQLKKLETAAGGRILERGDRQHAPLKVTPLGRKLLKQAEQELGLPQHPIVRAPLAPALGSFRGAERIAKLASASRQKTLREAAVAAGVTPQSLRISFRGLESACGPLVSAWGLDEAFHLTPRGQLLVRQWAAHHSA